jgi:hypothetical protein
MNVARLARSEWALGQQPFEEHAAFSITLLRCEATAGSCENGSTCTFELGVCAAYCTHNTAFGEITRAVNRLNDNMTHQQRSKPPYNHEAVHQTG